jgi:hypothetical protein
MESFRITIFDKTGIFQNGIFQKGFLQNGTFQKESLRKYFQQNRNLSEWNLSAGIFQNRLFGQTGIFQNGIF